MTNRFLSCGLMGLLMVLAGACSQTGGPGRKVIVVPDGTAVACAQIVDEPLQHVPWDSFDSQTAVRQWIKEHYDLSDEQILSQSHTWSEGTTKHKLGSESWSVGQAEYYVAHDETTEFQVTEISVAYERFPKLGQLLECFGPPDLVYAGEQVISPHGDTGGYFDFYYLGPGYRFSGSFGIGESLTQQHHAARYTVMSRRAVRKDRAGKRRPVLQQRLLAIRTGRGALKTF